MFGRNHDIDNSFSTSDEDLTRDVAEELREKIAELEETVGIWKEHSLIPLVQLYQQDIISFMDDIRSHRTNDGRMVITTFEGQEILNFFEKVMIEAKKVIS